MFISSKSDLLSPFREVRCEKTSRRLNGNDEVLSVWVMRLYSRCAAGPGTPLAARSPDCCRFSHFFSRPFLSSQSWTHSGPFASTKSLQLNKNGATFPVVTFCFFGGVLLLKPYRFGGGMSASCCFFSPLSRVVSGTDYTPESVSLPREMPLLLWLAGMAVVFVFSPSAVLAVPHHLIESTVPFFFPSLLHSLHPSHFLPPPHTSLISPCFTPLSACTFPLTHPGHVTPPFTRSLFQWGQGACCMLGVRARRFAW